MSKADLVNAHIEIMELRDELTKKADTNHSLVKQMADLESENAELRRQQITLRNERNTFLAQNEQYEKDLIDFNEQLTKAIEIIKKLLSCCRNYPQENAEKMEEAEQFLKEIEK